MLSLEATKPPYSPPPQISLLEEYEEVLAKLDRGYRLPCPVEVERISSWNPKELYTSVASSCFVANPNNRSNFNYIVKLFEEYLRDDEKQQYVQMTEIYQEMREEKYLKICQT